MAPTTHRRLLTADEFQRMAEAGILDEDERIELLGGEMYHMAAIGVRHAGTLRGVSHSVLRSGRRGGWACILIALIACAGQEGDR